MKKYKKAEYVDQNGVVYKREELIEKGANYKILNRYCNETNGVVTTLFTIKIFNYQPKLF